MEWEMDIDLAEEAIDNMRLDARDKFPSGMEDYLSIYGWHFSKKMWEWAVSKMYKNNEKGEHKPITPINKTDVDELLKRYNIVLDRKIGYDYVFVANMCIADYMGSSIEDEKHIALFIKDYVDDPDGYEELPFTRFYADCIGSGTPIDWEDVL